MRKNFKVQIFNFGTGSTTEAAAYIPHKDVQCHVLPDVIDRLNVTVDNGRLAISVNSQIIFYSASLNDASVDIFK